MTSIFKQMVEDAGMPTTEDGMKAEWDRLNAESDVQIANDSQWSPFWRLISAIVTTPAMWLVTLLIDYVLPNFFLKYASGSWLDLFAWGRDLERKAAVKTVGNILFTREDSTGALTIPAGVMIATPEINGKIYRVVTVNETVIPDGILSQSVLVSAEYAGSAYNLGAGYFIVLPEPVTGVASVTNVADWITTAGADEETDESLRLRCRNQFSAVGQYHHDAAYRSDICTFAGIQPDYVVFEHGAPRGPGTANAYVMIDSGAPTQAFVDDINDYITTQGNHGHGDDMLCMVIPTVNKDLTVTAYHSGALASEAVTALQNSVTNRVRCAFRENQDFEGITQAMPVSRFSFSNLAEEMHGQLIDLGSVKFSLDDIVLGIELPVLNSLTVTLEAS